MAVDVRAAEASFELGAPRALLATGSPPEVWPDYFYDTVDGERFLISEPEPGSTTSGSESTALINVIINWRSTLARHRN